MTVAHRHDRSRRGHARRRQAEARACRVRSTSTPSPPTSPTCRSSWRTPRGPGRTSSSRSRCTSRTRGSTCRAGRRAGSRPTSCATSRARCRTACCSGPTTRSCPTSSGSARGTTLDIPDDVTEKVFLENATRLLALSSDAERGELLAAGRPAEGRSAGSAALPALGGERVAHALALRLERDVGERGLATAASGIGGQAVERHPRRAAAVLVVPRDRDRLGEPVHAEHEHPERVALLPLQPRLAYSSVQIDFASSASRCSGSVIVATSMTSAQPGIVIASPTGAATREVDPVPVRGLQQLGPLVLGGRVQPEAARRARRSGGRLRGSRPCARRRSARPRAARARSRPIPSSAGIVDRRRGGHAGQDRTDDRRRRSPRGDHLGRTAARRALRRGPPASRACPGLLVLPGFPRGAGGAATVGNTYASLVDRIARRSGLGARSRSRSAAPARPRATSRSKAGSPTCAPRSTRSQRAPT